jgi:Ser/Thr protein kinase RdoA (MazF antagonist)
MMKVDAERDDLEVLARQVLRSWQFDGSPERVDIGVNKATWRVGDFWLSSEYAVAEPEVMRLGGLLDRAAAELAPGIAVPKFEPSSQGTVVRKGGHLWWVTRNLPGRHPDPSSASDMAAVAGGLAVMHEALRRVPREHAVSDDTCEGLFRAGERLVGDERLKFTPDDLDAAKQAADVVAQHLDAIRSRDMQVTHGDPSNPNLFVDGESPRLIGAIDWDYARFDLVISDVATMAQTILFRSDTDRPGEFLEAALTAYITAGGLELGLEEVLAGVLMVLFEAVAHHGNRYIAGQGAYDRVGGRIDNMRKVLSLLG